MILQSLELVNFRQYKNARIEFREGLVGIIGKNGTGKSTLFDAILLALYGEFPCEKEYLRFQRAGDREPVSVSMEMLFENREYSIKREFRGRNLTANAQLSCNGKIVATGQKEVTVEITRLVGMAADAFSRSIFAGQKELGLLSQLGDAERKAFIRKILGVTKIDDIQKTVRADASRIRDEISGQESMMLTAEQVSSRANELEGLSKTCDQLKTDMDAAEIAHGQAELKYAGSKERYFAEQKKKNEYDKIEKEISRLAEKKVQLEKRVELNLRRTGEIKVQVKRLKELGQSESEYLETVKQTEKLEKHKKSHDQAEILVNQIKENQNHVNLMRQELLSSFKDFSEEQDTDAIYDNLDKGYKELESKKANAEAARNSAEADLLSCRSLLAELKKSLETLSGNGADSRCPTCLRPLGEALDVTLEKLTIEINTISARQAGIEKQLKHDRELVATMSAQERNLREGLQEFKIKLIKISQKQEDTRRKENDLAAFGKIRFDREEYENAKKRARELKSAHEEHIRLEDLPKELPGLEKELASLSSELDDTSAQAKASENQKLDTGFSEKAFEAAFKSMQKTEAAKDLAAKALAELRDRLKDSRHMRQILEQDFSENEKRKKTVASREREARRLEKLVTLFDGFKTAILQQIQPQVGHYAGALFSKLTRGRYESIHVDGDFRFLIHDEGDYFPITRFSGGEQDLANLCLRLALSSAIRDLEGAAAPAFLGFDEIFGSQDRERRQEIMQALFLLQEQYRQILIISHDEDLKDEFPNILEVRRTDSGSVVRWLD